MPEVLTRTPIHLLSQDVAERIAAGEVIERPVSVVKELVENALDAGSHEIRVEIRGSGLRLVCVTDDGYGIPEDELERASARHTTSKINTLEDLGRLHTLGFRGEALASIAAVSELTLVSRPIESEELGEESAATLLTLRGGEVTRRSRRARLHGTTVTVRDLFYNVPARLKFMRGARTETGHILHLMRRYAVGYPGVRFNLTLEETTALQTSGTGDVATTLAELYHLPLSEMLHPVAVEVAGQYRIQGYVGNRALAQSSRQHIMLFINGRWVQSRGLLPKGKHPLLVFSLQLPTEDVDVNVHPAKTEVKLLHEAEIVAALTQAVQSVLERSPALPTSTDFPGPELVYQRRLPGPHRRGLHVAESAEEYKAEAAPPATSQVLATLRPLAQLQQAVILAEAPDGSLYLIDQHRAHERIIYEHLRNKHVGMRAGEGEEWAGTDSHLLLEPVIVELKRHQADLLEQRLPILRDLGIDEQRALIAALAGVSAPAVCPHGSPILLHYSRTFLIDKFDW